MTESVYRQWAQRIRKSDEDAFHELFMASYNPLIRFAYKYVKSTDTAKDLLQDVYTHLWQIRDRLDEEKSLKALLYQMTKNRCINQVNSHRSTRLDDLPLSAMPVEDGEPELPDNLDDSDDGELKHQLSKWIELLPRRQREAFKLSRFEGLDHHEIAGVLDCAPRTVNNHIVNALKVLRKHLNAWQNKRDSEYSGKA